MPSHKRKQLHQEEPNAMQSDPPRPCPPAQAPEPLPATTTTTTPQSPTTYTHGLRFSQHQSSLPSTSIAVPEQLEAKPRKKQQKRAQNQDQEQKKLSAQHLHLPPAQQQQLEFEFADFEIPTQKETRLRPRPQRSAGLAPAPAIATAPSASRSKESKETVRKAARTQEPQQAPGIEQARERQQARKLQKAQELQQAQKLHQAQGIEQAPPKQLPPGAVCISTLLSAKDLERTEQLAMPAALRRPNLSHKRKLSDHENDHAAKPNGVRTHSPIQKKRKTTAAVAHKNSLLNDDLPESTHSHPSQTHHPVPAAPSTSEERELQKSLERNIDRVIFGDKVFSAWYPSWYPKEIIGEKGLDGKAPTGIVVQTLYVCNKCFGYSKEVHDWVRHCRGCERELPGQRIYMHGAGEGKKEEECVWSVWEVDGDVDTVFCQNLSLFAKLFLDNKSVFFDVSGFNYYLLVHNPTSQVVGFFSKEKMSWDNNNLACILVFPPWQCKGLGSILMGVSYEISRREEILGGPEKPISDLGQKGYKRFWGREIARWLLEAKETDRKKGKGAVSVGDISRGTWIHGEDVLGILRDMGAVERVGKGRGDVERVLLDKYKVRDWVKRNGLSLERVVDRDGFVEGYGYKEVVEEEEAVD